MYKKSVLLKPIFVLMAVCFVKTIAIAQVVDSPTFDINGQNMENYSAWIFPNPVELGKSVCIRTSPTVKNIKITDALGKVVQEEDNKFMIYDNIIVSINNKNSGVYYAKITFEDDHCIVKKILVKDKKVK